MLSLGADVVLMGRCWNTGRVLMMCVLIGLLVLIGSLGANLIG
jgi:hypothetical protein